MFKKLLLAAALALFAVPAAAQNVQCSTRPAGDSTNACASTAFVQGIASGNLALASGQILVGQVSGFAGAVALSGDCTIAASGAITCTKTNGAAFGTFATANATVATAALNLFTSGLQGLVPASGGGTVNFLRADGTFASPSSSVISLPQNRLSLTSGVSVTTSDVAGATSVFLIAGQSATSNGTTLTSDTSAQLTLALDSNSGHTGYHQSGKNFDVFRINDSGTIRIGTGPAWTSDTARGSGAGTTELTTLGNTGIFVNANSILIRFGSVSGNTVTIPASQALYLGSFRTTADGQTEDSQARRFLYNNFNVAQRTLLRNESAVSWTVAKAASPGASGYSQANANTANKVEVLAGLTGGAISLNAAGQWTSSASGFEYLVGIGLNSTTVSSHTTSQEAQSSAVSRYSTLASYNGYLSLGYQPFNWLEQNFSDTGTATSFGTSADGRIKTGLVGSVWQ
jgi:hypothetical protein